MDTRIIKAIFSDTRTAVTESRMQYDYGQIIEILGVDLPESFEARFSNEPAGMSIRVLGNNKRVNVPDELLTSVGEIFCYITVHDTETDGRTVYTIKIPVKESTKRTDAQPTPVQQDIITQTISALNTAQNEWKNMSAEAVTLEPNQPATAKYKDGKLTLGIPKGEAGGGSGGSGTDGFSPIATVTQTPTGATITVTDKNGTTSANIFNGEKGSDADVTSANIASALGYTPANPADIPVVTNDFTNAYKDRVDTLWDDYQSAITAVG